MRKRRGLQFQQKQHTVKFIGFKSRNEVGHMFLFQNIGNLYFINCKIILFIVFIIIIVSTGFVHTKDNSLCL